jgi:hypothetical protein
MVHQGRVTLFLSMKTYSGKHDTSRDTIKSSIRVAVLVIFYLLSHRYGERHTAQFFNVPVRYTYYRPTMKRFVATTLPSTMICTK